MWTQEEARAADQHREDAARELYEAEQAVIEAAVAFRWAYRKDINARTLQAKDALFIAIDAYLKARGE
jgi:hypothetical protein